MQKRPGFKRRAFFFGLPEIPRTSRTTSSSRTSGPSLCLPDSAFSLLCLRSFGGFMKCLILFTLLLSTAACVKIADTPTEEPTTDQVSANRAVGPEVEPLPEPGHYQVHLPISEEVQVVQRSLKDIEDDVTVVPMKLEKHILTDDQVESGKSYVYELGFQKDGEFELVETYEIQIPQDLVIQNEVVLQKDEVWNGYARIFLGPQGVITSQNFNLVMTASSLITQGGLIRTFPANTSAAQGIAGRSGGSVHLNLKTGVGILNVELRGENGGAGKDQGPWAPPAGNVVGGIHIDFGNIHSLFVKGEPGADGLPGATGGKTGNFLIQIQEAHQLDVMPRFFPGTGGAPGKGGTGSPAAPDFGFSEGDRGKDGQTGANGSQEQACLRDLKGEHCW
jgi:hypothetical protein